MPADWVSTVLDYLLTSYQPDFAVVHGGRLLGVVTRAEVLQSLMNMQGDAYVTGIMNRNVPQLQPACRSPRRRRSWRSSTPASAPSSTARPSSA